MNLKGVGQIVRKNPRRLGHRMDIEGCEWLTTNDEAEAYEEWVDKRAEN